MNEEIKEILDYLKRSDKNKFGFEQGKFIDYEETQLLADYITNLQEENKDFKTIIKQYVDIVLHDRKVIDDYKSRCEKAIEYIMSDLITEWDIKNDGCVSGSDLPADAIIPILNILNGVDDK